MTGLVWVKMAGKFPESGRRRIQVPLFISEQRLYAGDDRIDDIDAAGSVIEPGIVGVGGGESYTDFFHHHVGAHHIVTLDGDMGFKASLFAECIKIFPGGESWSQSYKRFILHFGKADFPAL